MGPIEADQPITVLIEGSALELRRGRMIVHGFGFTAAPIIPAPPGGVIVDPRAGVPARLRSDQ